MNPTRLFRATALALVSAAAGGERPEPKACSPPSSSPTSTIPTSCRPFSSVKAAAEDVALRKAGKRPSLSASADYSANFGVANGNSTISDSVSVGLNFRQNLFDNYRTDSAIEIARAVVEVQMYALRNAEQNVLLSVANAYVSVVRDTQLVQLRQENVAFFEAQVSSAAGAPPDRRGHAHRRVPGRGASRPGASPPIAPRSRASRRARRVTSAGSATRRATCRSTSTSTAFCRRAPTPPIALAEMQPSRDPHRACRDPRRAGRHRCGRSRVRPHPRSHRLALRPQLLRRRRHDWRQRLAPAAPSRCRSMPAARSARASARPTSSRSRARSMRFRPATRSRKP